MKWILISGIAILFLFSSCTNNDIPSLEITITNEFHLDQSSQQYLYQMYTIAMDNPIAEELAFSNTRQPPGIVIADYSGNFIERIGKEGRGPEEIQSARFFGFDGDHNIVILDKNTALFKYFDRKTGEVRSFNYQINEGVSITSRNLEYCNGQYIVAIQLIGDPTITTSPIIGVFDSEFRLLQTFGGFDPFFQGKSDVMQEPLIKVDCNAGMVYTSHAKVPYIQIYSLKTFELIERIENIPPSFMLSETFIPLVTSPIEMSRFLVREQSLSLHLAYNDDYILHIFRDDGNFSPITRRLTDRNHFVAAYHKETFEFMGEAKIDGSIMGNTYKGELIVLVDEDSYEFKFIGISQIP